ncbi:MAG: hypothetical protein JW751_25060 [Polyangiaceae bacterium]|nr:hypothetical protein [Polyangiaceae bacterium]
MSTPKKPKPRRVKWSVGTALSEGKIVETLPMAEIQKLPKLSAVMIDFALPITSLMSAPISKRTALLPGTT